MSFRPPFAQKSASKVRLRQMKEEKKHDDGEETCQVCSDPVSKTSCLDCKHYICPVCVSKLESGTCGLCRAPITKLPFRRGAYKVLQLMERRENERRNLRLTEDTIRAMQAQEGEEVAYELP